MLKVCPRCGEPRILAPECPQCGVLYAKAEARAARAASSEPAPVLATGPVPAAPLEPSPSLEATGWTGDLEDARHELRLRLFALPGMLLVAWLLIHSPMWGRLMRIFLTMWVHELGHAVSAWFCGFPSIPGPWVTTTWDEPSLVVTALLATGFMTLVFRGFVTKQRVLVAAGATGLLLQFVGTGLLPFSSARQLIIFGGDGGQLVLGTLLLTTLYAPRESSLRQGWLHWGYMVIGAAAFTETFSQWWATRRDFSLIPFGSMEGVGLSDPSKLVEQYGWGELQLIHRYNALGLACLAGLALLYTVGVVRARAALQRLERRHGA